MRTPTLISCVWHCIQNALGQPIIPVVVEQTV